MDTSFDAFGAGGWGADQGNDFQASQSQATRSGNLDKVPVPVSIKDLVTITDESIAEQEVFTIGNYSFKTV
jgi:hypothetical protein